MRKLFEQFDKIVDFPHQNRGRVEIREGETYVRIHDANQIKEEYETDAFTSWDALQGLKPVAIASYIRACTRSTMTSHMSRRESAGQFRRMASIMVEVGLEDRTPATLTFYDCEDIIAAIAAREYQSPYTVLTPLRTLVEEIYLDPKLNQVRDKHLYVRKVPFPGRGRTEPREVLPDAVFGDIYARAAADCALIIDKFRSFQFALTRPASELPSRAKDLRTAEQCAVWVHREFGNRLPPAKAFRAENRALFEALRRSGGWKGVMGLIQPTALHLMPFMALLGCQTLFNKAVMTELSFGDIDRTDLAGTLRLVLTPLKKRAGRQQLRSFQIDDTPDNPDAILRFLEDYTAGLRGAVDTKFRDRVFLFWSLAQRRTLLEDPGPSAFTGNTTGSGSEDSRFSHAWGVWCEESGFPGVPFSALRVTGLNLGYRAFGGDVRAIAALASHSSAQVFDQHYKSPQSRARNDHRMAKAMLLRERLLASNGEVDPQRRLKGEGVQGATPGFGCLDPFSSPIPGQRAGRPCSAYGQCPGCPLATTDATIPANLVRMKQLEAEYMAAVTYLAPHYWRDKYSLHLATLRAEWLPVFQDPLIIAEAAKIQARPLPPLS